MIAHLIECHIDHEIVMASALPKPIPLEATVFVVLMWIGAYAPESWSVQ